MQAEYFNYTVYSDGRIYTHYRNKFLKPDITKFGYEQVALTIEGKREVFRVHQLVALLFVPNPDPTNFTIINHKDGNKRNNDFTNLEWCNYYINNKHARETGLNNISDANHQRWLNPEFRKRVSRNLSKAKMGKTIGLQNGNSKYLIMQGTSILSRRDVAKL